MSPFNIYSLALFVFNSNGPFYGNAYYISNYGFCLQEIQVPENITHSSKWDSRNKEPPPLSFFGGRYGDEMPLQFNRLVIGDSGVNGTISNMSVEGALACMLPA